MNADPVPPLRRPANLLLGTAAIGVLALIVLLFTSRWRWSFLMDDWVYARMVATAPGASWVDLAGESVSRFFSIGRAVPLYAATNMLFWKFFPVSPLFFHAFTLALFFFLIALAYFVLEHALAPRGAEKAWLAGVLVVLFIAARPVLDTATLITIPEPWVEICVVLGFAAADRRPVVARLLFAAGVFYKEPALAAFLALFLASYIDPPEARTARRWVDLGLFGLGFIAVNLFRKTAGGLASISIFSVDTVRHFALGAAKVFVWSAPSVVLWATYGRRALATENRGRRKLFAFWLAFSAIYLGMTALVPPAGYRLGPPAFGIAIASAAAALTAFRDPRFGARMMILFVGVGAATLSTSLYRYARMNASIHGSAEYIESVLSTRTPMTLVVQGSEHRGTVEKLAASLGSPARVILADEIPNAGELTRPVVLIENTAYFSRVGANELRAFETIAGGWREIEEKGGFRVFIGAPGLQSHP